MIGELLHIRRRSVAASRRPFTRQGVIRVPGGRVWYGVCGEGRKPPLVAVHGGPGIPHDYLLPAMAELADRDDRPVILYDQLGCGRSERPGDPALWTVERFRDELACVVEQAGIKCFHLWGHSWGAQLALNYAVTRPAGLLSLTLAGPVIDVPSYRADLGSLVASQSAEVQQALRREAVGSPGYEQAIGRFYAAHLHTVVPPPESWRTALSSARFGTQPYAAMVGPDELHYTGTLRDVDDSHLLSSIEAPVSFHCGRADIATPRRCERYRLMTPWSELKIFERSSHAFFDEERALFVRTLRDWLSRNDVEPLRVPWKPRCPGWAQLRASWSMELEERDRSFA